ncbi:MAG: proline--tRNA ligase [bacterium]|nr:proline--tRNA ligase [bacterium]
MKWTKMMIQTLREDPGDAEIDSHKLLVRASLVKKVAGGLFTYLPLGMRSLNKVAQIVREEMDRAGAQEIVMPILQPAELWKTSGRWETMGPGMFRLQDRGQHAYALSPTAEEVVTDLAKNVVSSYRQLPVTVYQIQWKFRDEIRPRFGLMRSKEFLMKDAYSFDTSLEAADASYMAMFEAYTRIFARCGLKAYPVEADTGDIGGKFSHEFHVLADAGEDGIAFCDGCGYAANLEKAGREVAAAAFEPCPPCAPAPTPAKSIEDMVKLFGVPATRMVKTLVYVADGQPVLFCVRGDRELNEVKAKHLVGAKRFELADFETVQKVTGAPVGYAGPVKPPVDVPIYADLDLRGAKGMITGGNLPDEVDLNNVDFDRDCKIAGYADLVVVRDGDVCPHCGKPLVIKRGIEVGHVFKLGTKYTDAFKAVYKTDELKEQVMVMGCYGIGVSRTVQAVIEQCHDKDGIVWPAAVAPFQVVIDLLDPKDEAVAKVAADLETQLEAAGIDVLVDDREERPGVKFKDADLIGFTVRVVVGAKGLARGGVEVKARRDPKEAMKVVAPADAVAAIRDLLA